MAIGDLSGSLTEDKKQTQETDIVRAAQLGANFAAGLIGEL